MVSRCQRSAAKNHRRRAERQWVKAANTVSKQIFNAAKRLVAKMVHKAKSLFLGNEIANATSSKQLFNVCGRLIGRKRSSPLPSLYPIHDLPDVFKNYFVQKVQSIRADLDQQSMSPMSCRLTDQTVVSMLSSLHPITEAELRATILKSKPTSCSLDHLPISLLLKFLDDLLPTLMDIINSSLLSGTFPLTFRTAVVKPLLKKV